METTEIISEPRRLTRPKDDRWLGGVAPVSATTST